MTLANLICSSCGAPHERTGQRYCAGCHAESTRAYRRRVAAERRASRANARVARDGGLIEPQPCQVCGSADSQMHHPDHEMPTFVIWLCRMHHMAWHEHWKLTVLNIFCEWIEVARACAAVRRAEEAPTIERQERAA